MITSKICTGPQPEMFSFRASCLWLSVWQRGKCLPLTLQSAMWDSKSRMAHCSCHRMTTCLWARPARHLLHKRKQYRTMVEGIYVCRGRGGCFSNHAFDAEIQEKKCNRVFTSICSSEIYCNHSFILKSPQFHIMNLSHINRDYTPEVAGIKVSQYMTFTRNKRALLLSSELESSLLRIILTAMKWHINVFVPRNLMPSCN